MSRRSTTTDYDFAASATTTDRDVAAKRAGPTHVKERRDRLVVDPQHLLDVLGLHLDPREAHCAARADGRRARRHGEGEWGAACGSELRGFGAMARARAPTIDRSTTDGAAAPDGPSFIIEGAGCVGAPPCP